jgi:hypothetical protein
MTELTLVAEAPTCRGSKLLGSACGTCARCVSTELVEQPVEKKRRGRKPCSGHKLDMEDVIAIRELYAARAENGASLRKLAAEYRVSYEMIRRIVKQICWKV